MRRAGLWESFVYWANNLSPWVWRVLITGLVLWVLYLVVDNLPQ